MISENENIICVQGVITSESQGGIDGVTRAAPKLANFAQISCSPCQKLHAPASRGNLSPAQFTFPRETCDSSYFAPSSPYLFSFSHVVDLPSVQSNFETRPRSGSTNNNNASLSSSSQIWNLGLSLEVLLSPVGAGRGFGSVSASRARRRLRRHGGRRRREERRGLRRVFGRTRDGRLEEPQTGLAKGSNEIKPTSGKM